MTVSLPTTPALTMPSANESSVRPSPRHHHTEKKKHTIVVKQREPSVIFPQLPVGTPNLSLSCWSKVSCTALKRRAVTSRTPGAEPVAEIVLKCKVGDDFQPIVDKLIQEASTFMDWTDPSVKLVARSDLRASMDAFQEFCQEHFKPDKMVGYKFKLGAMQGSSCTRCPSFHQDNVPVRWLQTLHGPSSVYIDPCLHSQNVQLHKLLTEFHSHESKERMIKESGIVPQYLTAGQAAMIVGKVWSEWAKDPRDSNRSGVLHRSPVNASATQTRALFIMDVVGTHDEACPDNCPCAQKVA